MANAWQKNGRQREGVFGFIFLPPIFLPSIHCRSHENLALGHGNRVAAEKGSIQSETFKIMERRLYKGIITPAMIATWIFGLIMVFTPGIIDWHEGWVWVKAVSVIALSGIHGYYGRQVRNFAADRNERPHGFWRVVNELPFVLVIIIVIMVIVRPF